MKKGDDYIMYNKIIHKYHDCDIKVIIEIPKQNEERDNDIIKEIKKIMNNELLLQINK
ncbi:MAG: hypothetical protein OSJ45_01875 [Lachnospiraceae bacterium]|nr:hypothetical protein [Lachnospiraceae bacterium]